MNLFLKKNIDQGSERFTYYLCSVKKKKERQCLFPRLTDNRKCPRLSESHAVAKLIWDHLPTDGVEKQCLRIILVFIFSGINFFLEQS